MSRDTNRGDFAILAAAHRALSERDPDATITAVSVELGNVGLDDPQYTGLTRGLGSAIVGTPVPPRGYFSGSAWGWAARLLWCECVLTASLVIGNRAFRLMPRDTRAFCDTIREADMVVAKGGSYLHALGGMREIVYLWRMLYPIRVGKRFGPPVVLLGVSVGEFRSRGARRLARAVLRRGVMLYVREARSMEIVRRELRLPPQSVKLIPDLAFLIGPTETETDRTAPAPRIGVTVRAHSHPQGDREAALRNYVQSLGMTLRTMLDGDENLTVVFIPQVTEDRVLAREIAAYVSRPARVEVLDNDVDLEALLRIYGTLELLIAARLHSVILAAAVGVPAVHVVYEPSKSYGTLDLLGMTEFGISYEDVSSDRLTALISEARQRRGELHELIVDRVQALRAQVKQVIAADWEKWDRQQDAA